MWLCSRVKFVSSVLPHRGMACSSIYQTPQKHLSDKGFIEIENKWSIYPFHSRIIKCFIYQQSPVGGLITALPLMMQDQEFRDVTICVYSIDCHKPMMYCIAWGIEKIKCLITNLK